MEVARKVAVVTGGGGGIGGAIAARLAQAGARVVVADRNAGAARLAVRDIAGEYPGAAIAVEADVSIETQIRALIERTEAEFGAVDLFFANAGISGGTGIGADERDWDAAIDVNLRAHIRAARLLLPHWLERGSGYFVGTASAAGLLSQIGSAPYAVTKHAAVAFAEWLSITYGARGIRVSCLCPMGVDTPMLYAGRRSGDPLGVAATSAVTSAGAVLDPADVADAVLDAIGDERFLIVPHPNVLDMFRRKSADYERWLRGMRRYQAELLAQFR